MVYQSKNVKVFNLYYRPSPKYPNADLPFFTSKNYAELGQFLEQNRLESFHYTADLKAHEPADSQTIVPFVLALAKTTSLKQFYIPEHLGINNLRLLLDGISSNASITDLYCGETLFSDLKLKALRCYLGKSELKAEMLQRLNPLTYTLKDLADVLEESAKKGQVLLETGEEEGRPKALAEVETPKATINNKEILHNDAPPIITFLNEGEILIKDLSGAGKFTNKGNVKFTGTAEDPSLVEIKEFAGDFNQTSGYHKDLMCSLYDSSMIWKNVIWTGASKEYMLPHAKTSWTFDNVTCSKPIIIHNHGSLHLIDSILTFSHLINHGKVGISGGNYYIKNLSTIKRSTPGLIRFQDKACDFMVYALDHQGEIYVDPEIKQKIPVNSGTITGKAIGKNLVLDVEKLVTNKGDIALWNLDGSGKFINKAKLQFTGDQQNYSTLRIKEFENGSEEAGDQSAKLKGSHIVVNGLNKEFITHDNSDIMAKKFSFTKLGDINSQSTLELKGKIHTNELDIDRHKTVNLGTIETLIFTINGEKFKNGNGRMVVNAKNALLHVEKLVNSNATFFDNHGEMYTKGVFTQKKGILQMVQGTWLHQGDVDTTLSGFTSYGGQFIWQNGLWKGPSGGGCVLRGESVFDNMTLSEKIKIDNSGDLHLKKGEMEFSTLINSKNLILSEGSYLVDALENHGLLSLLENNWALTLNIFINGLIKNNYQNSLRYKTYSGTGEIECEKELTWPAPPVTPKKVIAHGGLVSSLIFNEQAQIETPKITCHYPRLTTLRDYKFTTINILNLIISGPFSLNHTLTAGTITLDVIGKFSLGTSNTNMGTLAATEGGLTVKAEIVDGSYGKIFGQGPTSVKSTTGDILIGAAKGGGPFLHTKNGAYIASGDTLLIESKQNLNVNYGQIDSIKDLTLRALNIRNMAGDIFSRGDIFVFAPSFNITRDGIYKVGVADWTWAYETCYVMCEISDQAFMRSLGSIYYNVDKGYCLASTIVAQKNIFYRPFVSGMFANEIFKETRSSSFEVHSRSNYGGGHNKKFGWDRGSSPCSTYHSTVQAGEKFEITTGSFTIPAIMNSPVFIIQALKKHGSGTGTFMNPCRSRSTLNILEPIVIDLTETVEHMVGGSGFYLRQPNGEIQTAFPFGVPSTPAPNQILYLNDGKTPHEVVQQEGLIRQHKNWQNPENDFRILKPLGSLNLDSFIQMALSKNAGKVHFKDEFGNKHKGNDLYKAVMGNSGKWIQKQNKNCATHADLMAMTGVMLLLQLQQDAAGIQEKLKLVIGPDEINPYQSAGDISGGKFLCHTDGQQNHFNNRIVMEDDIEITSNKGIKRETQTYETVSEHNGTTTHKVNAMPQQQFISLKGSVKEIADEDLVDIGTATEAAVDVFKESATGNIIEKTLILPTTVTTTQEDSGLFSSETTTTSTTTHEFLQTTVKAGRKGALKAKKAIDLQGSQHIADELFYWGLNYNNASVLVANTSSTTTHESGMFSDKSTSIYQETPAAAFAYAMAKQIYILCDTIATQGATFQANVIVDGSDKGGKYGPLVKEMKHHQQISFDTPLSSLNAGQEGGQEAEVRTAFNVEKIIHQPKGQVVLEDNTYREVELISGDDNACGFSALQHHLGVAPEKARERAVRKILAALDNPKTQEIICNLIAPEIQDGAFGGDNQLGYLDGAGVILTDYNKAELIQAQAMSIFREIFGQEETKGQTPEELLKSMKPATDAPVTFYTAYRKLQQAVKIMTKIQARKEIWAKNPEIVKQFLLCVVAQPNWTLNFVPAYLQTPTGVMDALAYVLGVNVKVLTEAEGKTSVIHAHEANPEWPTVELLHCEYELNSGYKNHFNLLKKAEDPTGMTFINTDIDKQVTEIIGAYHEEFYALKKWNREWCEKSQAVPDAALVVIAIAVVVLTKGMGAGIVNGMAGATATTAGATTATLSATQIAMANVAFSSLAAKVTTSLLKTGDPIACVKEVLSKDSLRNLAITIASAGVAEKVGGLFEVNMGAGEKAFVEHFQEHAIRNTSALAVGTLAGQHLNGDMVLNTAANTVFDAVSARVANNRGQAQRAKPVHPVFHGVGHAVDAFSIGYISSKLTGAKDPLKVAGSRAFGAFTAETFGSYLIEPGETKAKALENAADISRVVTAALGVALGFDGNDVDKGAMNALSNNFLTAAEEEEDKEERKKKSLYHYIYGNVEEDDLVSPLAAQLLKGKTVPKEDLQERRNYMEPVKFSPKGDWLIVETPLEKVREYGEEFMGRFNEIDNKSFSEMKAHEYFGILPLYSLKGIGFLDSCIGSPLSKVMQRVHDRAQDVGNVFRDGTLYVTGNRDVSQDVGYGVELGLEAIAALTPIKFFKGSRAPTLEVKPAVNSNISPQGKALVLTAPEFGFSKPTTLTVINTKNIVNGKGAAGDLFVRSNKSKSANANNIDQKTVYTFQNVSRWDVVGHGTPDFAINYYAFRNLNWRDLGGRSPLRLNGTLKQINDAVTIKIDSLGDVILKPSVIMHHLMETVKSLGEGSKPPKTLTLKGKVFDQNFKKYFIKNPQLSLGGSLFDKNKITISLDSTISPKKSREVIIKKALKEFDSYSPLKGAHEFATAGENLAPSLLNAKTILAGKNNAGDLFVSRKREGINRNSLTSGKKTKITEGTEQSTHKIVLADRLVQNKQKTLPFINYPKVGTWKLSDARYSNILILSTDDMVFNESVTHMTRSIKAPYLVWGHGNENFVTIARNTLVQVFPITLSGNLMKAVMDKVKSIPNSPNRIFPVSSSLNFVEKSRKLTIDHRTLAKVIENQPDYKKGQPIMMGGCSNGKDLLGIAQKLSDKLNVIVYAPSEDIWHNFMNNGMLTVAKPILKNDINFPDYSKLGEIRTFYPGGGK